MKQKQKILSCIVLILFLGVAAGIGYVNDYYRAQPEAKCALESKDGIYVQKIEEGYLFDGPGTEKALIFYPGAKVETIAYAPLLREIAAGGVDCILVDMPCHLALLGMEKAEAIQKQYTYKKWYLGGHSLGGACAAMYAKEHKNTLDGLIFLAAYASKDLSDQDLSVLSIYGSKDGVMNREKMQQYHENLPKDTKTICVEGGNHANFGNYGEQAKDKKAAISSKQQQEQTSREILAWIEDEI